ncbi:unnamed protein product [Agarophyton chilense]
MSSIQEGLQAITQEPTNQPIITRFFRFAAALAFFPLLAFFLVRRLIAYFHLPDTALFSAPILGGLVAVLTVNIIISTFALLALTEPSQAAESVSISPQPQQQSQLQQSEQHLQASQTREKTE